MLLSHVTRRRQELLKKTKNEWTVDSDPAMHGVGGKRPVSNVSESPVTYSKRKKQRRKPATSGGMPYQHPIGVVPQRLNATSCGGRYPHHREDHRQQPTDAKLSALFYELATNNNIAIGWASFGCVTDGF